MEVCTCFRECRYLYQSIVVRDFSVGIATNYGMDGPGIEFRWGRNFLHLFRPAEPAFYTVGIGIFPEVKRPGRGVDHPYTSNAEVQERVELYLDPPLGFRGLLQEKLCIYIYIYIYICQSMTKRTTISFSVRRVAAASDISPLQNSQPGTGAGTHFMEGVPVSPSPPRCKTAGA
jgi:hypothetical protein